MDLGKVHRPRERPRPTRHASILVQRTDQAISQAQHTKQRTNQAINPPAHWHRRSRIDRLGAAECLRGVAPRVGFYGLSTRVPWSFIIKGCTGFQRSLWVYFEQYCLKTFLFCKFSAEKKTVTNYYRGIEQVCLTLLNCTVGRFISQDNHQPTTVKPEYIATRLEHRIMMRFCFFSWYRCHRTHRKGGRMEQTPGGDMNWQLRIKRFTKRNF